MNQPLALVIEDQENLTMLYEDMLRILGYDVRCIKDGLSAINQIELLQDIPHLILLDINLPRLSGRDVLKHILRRDQLKDAHVIIVTANNLMAEQMRPLLRKGDYFFLKPVRMADLRQVAEEVKLRPAKPDYLKQTAEVPVIDETVSMDAVLDDESDQDIPSEDSTKLNPPDEDELFITSSEATIVNRNGMLWLKNALAEAAAKKATEEAEQQTDASSERSQEAPHESKTGD
jgi:two-component system cell cycle response regulator DivK